MTPSHSSNPGDRPAVADEDEPVLPDITRDESARGWGDEHDERPGRSDEWYRRERPPHHE